MGTPWTLAAYSIEGKADKECKETKVGRGAPPPKRMQCHIPSMWRRGAASVQCGAGAGFMPRAASPLLKACWVGLLHAPKISVAVDGAASRHSLS